MKKNETKIAYGLVFAGIFFLTMWAWRNEGVSHGFAKWAMAAVLALATLEEVRGIVAGPKRRLSKVDQKLFRVFHSGGVIISASLLGFVTTGSLMFSVGVVAGIGIAAWAFLIKAKALSKKQS